ncbi:hypothetical protein TNIN_471831 [Trichonephila inaurata madagascariensis]|uniref:Uncharacterized protein n=1 Tax=Trichonephila inaurata madagascariensis TaxID=2747483 RepID=A0A8X6IEB5_9ARAC|nr:hypothetical protein TNIN_471831 [Trichonephila inaurata madagascariensis]
MGYSGQCPTFLPLQITHCTPQRIELVRERRHWILDMFENGSWTNESRCKLVKTDNKVQVWHKNYGAMDFSIQQGIFQADGGDILVRNYYVRPLVGGGYRG